jgi:hypothetical protein
MLVAAGAAGGDFDPSGHWCQLLVLLAKCGESRRNAHLFSSFLFFSRQHKKTQGP